MNKTIRRALAVCMFVFMSTGYAASLEYPTTFGRWVQERVGPVVFSEGSSRTWPEFTDLASDLGARAVKTWVGATKPGEAIARLKSEPYRELVRRFRVVHFNLSFSYVADDYQPGVIAPASLNAVRDEWIEITRFLCREWPSPDRIFLLSVGGELNVYLGTANARPDFPVAEFVNACHAAKETALAEFVEETRPRVFSVAEIQGDIEYERFTQQWAPQFTTDLVSLSHYTFYRSLAESLAILRPCVKPMGPFGEQRLMLGEYGPCLEVCNENQAEHVRWHNDILQQAYKEHLQFAFFYEIADHEGVIKTGSHDGLMTWTPEAVPRLAWTYYQRLYQGKGVMLPENDLYEVRQAPTEPTMPRPILEVKEFSATGPHPSLGQRTSFRATITNSGDAPSKDTTVNFYAHDRMFSWVWIPSLAPGGNIQVQSDQGDARFAWIAQTGVQHITARVDPTGRNPAACQDDRSRRICLKVEASDTEEKPR